MGIQGLLQFIKEAAEPTHVKKYKGQVVAVDTYCWLHKGAYACAEKLAKGEATDQYVVYCMKLVDMLLSFGVKPILVFDGCTLPSKKEVEKTRREKRQANLLKGKQLLREGKLSEARECFSRSINVTHAMAREVIKVRPATCSSTRKCVSPSPRLWGNYIVKAGSRTRKVQAARAQGIDCLVAPYEADAQLAYLNKTGMVQAIITEDSDLLTFGCKKVFLKIDKFGNGLEIDQARLGMCKQLGDVFTEEKFRYMCILSGCDYLPSIHGIGLGKSCKLLKIANNPDIIKYDSPYPLMPVMDSVDPASWRQGLHRTGIVLVPSKGEKSLFPTSAKISPKEEERKDESPASWRLGLRKTGSYGALAEITASKETQKEKDSTGVMRSASSPRLSSSLDNKDKEKDTKTTRLAYVAPTIPRRLASTSDIEEKENRDSSASIIRGSGSYTRRKWEEDAKKNISNEGTTSLNSSYQKSSSFGRRQDDLINTSVPNTTSISTVTSLTGLQKNLLSNTTTAAKATTGSATSVMQSSTSNRLWADDSSEKDKDNVSTALTVPVPPSVLNTGVTTTALTTTTTGTVSSSEVRERRRSYLTPVRDEESESQRKARSRQARQSRRSTQGVTLTDLQEAEKTIGRSRTTRTREQENEEKEKEEKEKQDKEKQEEKKESETKDDDYRQRYTRTLEEPYHRYRTTSSIASSASSVATSSNSSSQLNRPNSIIGITSAYSRSAAKENERETEKKEEEKEEDKSQTKSIRERRRPREKRRSTGVSFWTQDSDENEQEHLSDSEEGTNKKEAQSDSHSRYDLGSCGDRCDSVLGRTGYSYLEDRKLYTSKLEKEDTADFKKLYEQIIAENEKLKAQLHDTNMELTDLKLQLEKATQRQERFADRSLLEMEKRERRALERRISEMEEELKMLPDLKADNQRLKDENGALIRVISKLSK